MIDLVTRAQLAMLAETLGVSTDRVQHLERLGATGLRHLRERISELLFDEQAAVFARLNKLGSLVPNSVVTRISEAIVPPLVAGRAAGALGMAHPHRASGVLTDLSPEYLADCAPYLDERAVAVLAPNIPAEVLIPVANELMARKAYVTASWFLDYATPELVLGLEAGIEDKAGLLRTTALVQSVERLEEIIRTLPSERLAVIVRTAVTAPELLLDGLSMLSRLPAELTAELADVLFDELDEVGLVDVVRTAVRHGAGAELLVVAAALRPAALRRLSGGLSLADRELVDSLVAAADGPGSWAGLRRLGDHLTGVPARLVAHRLAEARPAAS